MRRDHDTRQAPQCTPRELPMLITVPPVEARGKVVVVVVVGGGLRACG